MSEILRSAAGGAGAAPPPSSPPFPELPILAPRTPRVAIAGNPNTGKTTLFNRLTGSRAKVGNYPGVTVDRHHGRLRLTGLGEIELMDVPGTYSLSARSQEEQLAIQAVAGLHPLERPDAVLMVVDATQLLRNLYLVLQLIELELPLVVALNMVDQLARTGQEVDAPALSRELGVPVVPIVAQTGQGVPALGTALADVLRDPARGISGPRWMPEDAALVADVDAVAREIPASWHGEHAGRRHALALWGLLSIEEHDELHDVPERLRRVVHERHRAAEAAGRSIEEEVIQGRYAWIDAHGPGFLRENPAPLSVTDRIDRVLLHPALGFVIFLGVMTIVFQSLFAWADPVIGWIEDSFAWLADATRAVLPAGIGTDLFVGGVIQGVGSVLVFLPQILLLFFFIGLMEDSGYMARVAFLMDRIMKSIGLHGRAFVPMLSGYACAVPAILATRTMERRRDRLLTMMVVPLMTCSARLPVYGLLIAALYPPERGHPFAQGLMLVGMYLFSTVVALVAAAVLGRTVLKGPRVPLLLEMPPYRMPHWPSVLRMMWQKSSVFVREAGTVILGCTIAIWVLLNFPRHPQLDQDYGALRVQARAEAAAEPGQAADRELEQRLADLDHEESGARLRASWGGHLGRALEPALRPLGFDWKIGIGLIGAFAAREVFVSTMGVVYGIGNDADESSPGLRERIREQRWPDGRLVFTPLVILGLMIFFALACQCMSTLAAVRRETQSWGWPVFLFSYMTALAWIVSLAIHQGGHLLGLG